MPEFQKIEELTDTVKQYVLLNIELLKLEATKQVSTIGSSVVGALIVGIAAFLFVFTLSIGLGFYLSALLGDSYSGFAIIAAFYFLLVIILFLGRRKHIEKPLREIIITKILENHSI